MPSERAGFRRTRLGVLLAVLVLSSCSSRTTYREEDGRCIERDRQRIFGLTWLDNEFGSDHPCPEDGS